jgi:hypothetical protein
MLPAITRRAVPLMSALPLGAEPLADVDTDGTVTIRNMLPGTYRPGFTLGNRTAIAGWWLKSVVVNGRDLLDAPFDIRESLDGIVVTFSDAASEVTGRIADATGEPVAGTTVVIFSTDRTSWFDNSRRIAAVRTDLQGRYTIRNLPMGDYLVVVDDDIEAGEWFNPQFLQKLAAAAAPIRLRADEKATYDVTLPSR